MSAIKITEFPKDEPDPPETPKPEFWAMGCGAVLALVIAAVSLGAVVGLFGAVAWLVFRWVTGG